MTVDFDPVQTLGVAIMVLYTGMFVIGRIRFLSKNDIPVPVVGGLLFALITGLLFGQFDIRIGFDMALREPMMLAFFASIGLGADLRMLARGKPSPKTIVAMARELVGYLWAALHPDVQPAPRAQ